MTHEAHGRLKPVVLIKGVGEMATGVAHRLFRSGFCVCLTDLAELWPGGMLFRTHLRRRKNRRRGKAVRVEGRSGIYAGWDDHSIPILIDPQCRILEDLRPDILMDAIMAKRNTGTQIGDALLVIGLDPGFRARRFILPRRRIEGRASVKSLNGAGRNRIPIFPQMWKATRGARLTRPRPESLSG